MGSTLSGHPLLMQIYIHKNGQTTGPFDLEQIKHALQSNQFTLADLAHTQGMSGWQSLHDVLSMLRDQAKGATAPLPPAVPNQNQTGQHQPHGGGKIEGSTAGIMSNPAIRAFLNEEQDPAAVTRVYDRLMQICMADEQVLYIAVQKKPLINISPAAVALSNKRVIIFRPQTFGLALSFDDHYWLNVVNVHITEAVLGSTFFVRLNDNRQPFVDSLPKAQARRLYQFGQQMEEQMHRHRRELMLEERRAGAGNFNVAMNNMQAPPQNSAYPQQMPPQQQLPPYQQVPSQQLPPNNSFASSQHAFPPAQSQAMAEDPVEVLSKLKAMLDRGLISQAEYDAKKTEIMARL